MTGTPPADTAARDLGSPRLRPPRCRALPRRRSRPPCRSRRRGRWWPSERASWAGCRDAAAGTPQPEEREHSRDGRREQRSSEPGGSIRNRLAAKLRGMSARGVVERRVRRGRQSIV